MLSKQALGTATFLFILAVLCTALVLRVGSLAHGPKQHHIPNTFGINFFHFGENSAPCFKTTVDLFPALKSSAFRSRDMTG